jgi:uncharacterized integral membrane protein
MSESGSMPQPTPGRGAEASVPSQPTGGEPEPVRRPVQTKDPLRGSRASGVWAAVVALVVLLILLSVFILQNTRSVEISYFGWDGDAPLAAMLLIAVAAGLAIAVIAGSLRILQLRRRVRHEQKR